MYTYMPRFWKAEWKRKWKSYAQKRLVGHYRGLTRSQRSRLRKLLKKARLDNKLSQRQAGELLGQDQMFISKIESGHRQVDFIEVEHLAQIYRKELSFFSTLRRIH
jgi:Helix-turn-helix